MPQLLIDEQFLPTAMWLIKQAQSSIYVTTFKAEMTTKPRGELLLHFFETLKQKAAEKIKVYFLINWNIDRRSVAKTNLYAAAELKKADIIVKHLRNNRCCHTKLIIVDEEVAILGSHNLSVKSCANNFEISIMTDAPDIVSRLVEVFQYAYASAQPF